MSNYTVYLTDSFRDIYFSLGKAEQEWIKKIKQSLEENVTGKILKYEWFREKKYENKRLYFLVDYKNKKILFVSFSKKKQQQKIIDLIIINKEELLEYLRRI